MFFTVISVGAIIVALPLAFMGMWYFDKIVKYEHDHFHEEWQQDGAPSGYFWIAEGQPPRVNTAGGQLATRIIYKTPSWIGNTQIESTLRSYRRIFWFFLASLVLALVALVINAVY